MSIRSSATTTAQTFEFKPSWKPREVIGVLIPALIGFIVGFWSHQEGWFLLGGPIVVLGAAYSAYLVQGVVARHRKGAVFVAYEPAINMLSATWPGEVRPHNQVSLDKVSAVQATGGVSRSMARKGRVPMLIIQSPITDLHLPVNTLAAPEVDALLMQVIEDYGSPTAREAVNSAAGRNFAW